MTAHGAGDRPTTTGDGTLRILFWLFTIPFLALAGAFAAANHQPLTLRLWPFPLEAQVPIYAAVLGAFFLGLLVAALWFWTAGLGGRLARRRSARHQRALEQETTRLKRQLAEKNRAPPAAAATGHDDTRARRLIAAGDG
ncbi:MAG: LapA family protein [Alphaproteobacteria bacterium]|nr:MAG: LapA family protein [Alphaproteobacteria bacterium]